MAGLVAPLRSPTTPGVGSKNPKQDLGFLLTSYGVRTYSSYPTYPNQNQNKTPPESTSDSGWG